METAHATTKEGLANADRGKVLAFDVVVIGGGPAGSACATRLAQKGRRVAVIEKAAFPRFHVGESMLPASGPLLAELGLTDKLHALQRVRKTGAEFGLGDADPDGTSQYPFARGLAGSRSETFNVERAAFDACLAEHARACGVAWMKAAVRRIDRLSDGDCLLSLTGGTHEQVQAAYVMDASGQSTVLAKHLSIRRKHPCQHFQKVAYAGHFTGCKRPEGERGGYPLIAMSDEGWFWCIPIDEHRTSIGLVLDEQVAKHVQQSGVLPKRMLAWGLQRCPLMMDRVRGAQWPDQNRVIADYSYTCQPYGGPGCLLIGDAAGFLDPVFSSGVFLALSSALDAADLVDDTLAGRRSPGSMRRRYARKRRRELGTFLEMIGGFYDHAFRELLLHAQGPVGVTQAVTALLTGHVRPRVPWAVRWRMGFFRWSWWLQRRMSVVPRRAHFSLLAQPPEQRCPETAEQATGPTAGQAAEPSMAS